MFGHLFLAGRCRYSESVLTEVHRATSLPIHSLRARCCEELLAEYTNSDNEFDKETTATLIMACRELLKTQSPLVYIDDLESSARYRKERQQVAQARNFPSRLLDPNFPLEIHITILLMDDDVNMALQVVGKMEKSDLFDDEAKHQAWKHIFVFMLQKHLLYLDDPNGLESNVSTSYKLKKELLLFNVVEKLKLCGWEAMIEFHNVILEKIWSNPQSTIDEKRFVLLSTQKTILRCFMKKSLADGVHNFWKLSWPVDSSLLFNGSNGSLLTPPPSAPPLPLSMNGNSGLSDGAVANWAFDFLQTKNPVPASLLDEDTGEVDLMRLVTYEPPMPEEMPPEEMQLAPEEVIDQVEVDDEEEDGIEGDVNDIEVASVEEVEDNDGFADGVVETDDGDEAGEEVVIMDSTSSGDGDDDGDDDDDATEEQDEDPSYAIDGKNADYTGGMRMDIDGEDEDDGEDADDADEEGAYDVEDNQDYYHGDDKEDDGEVASHTQATGTLSHPVDILDSSPEKSTSRQLQNASDEEADSLSEGRDDEDGDYAERPEEDGDEANGATRPQHRAEDDSVEDGSSVNGSISSGAGVPGEAKAETDVAADRGVFGDTTEEEEEDDDEEQGRANRAAQAHREADVRAASLNYSSQLEEGYEPEDTHGYTEEEVSEAIHTEDEEEERRLSLTKSDSNRELDPTAQSREEVGPVASRSLPHSSDDMDAADEHTEQEEDLGAESSELEETADGPPTDGLPTQPSQEFMEVPPGEGELRTLQEFAHSAMRRHDTVSNAPRVPVAESMKQATVEPAETNLNRTASIESRDGGTVDATSPANEENMDPAAQVNMGEDDDEAAGAVREGNSEIAYSESVVMGAKQLPATESSANVQDMIESDGQADAAAALLSIPCGDQEMDEVEPDDAIPPSSAPMDSGVIPGQFAHGTESDFGLAAVGSPTVVGAEASFKASTPGEAKKDIQEETIKIDNDGQDPVDRTVEEEIPESDNVHDGHVLDATQTGTHADKDMAEVVDDEGANHQAVGDALAGEGETENGLQPTQGGGMVEVDGRNDDKTRTKLEEKASNFENDHEEVADAENGHGNELPVLQVASNVSNDGDEHSNSATASVPVAAPKESRDSNEPSEEPNIEKPQPTKLEDDDEEEVDNSAPESTEEAPRISTRRTRATAQKPAQYPRKKPGRRPKTSKADEEKATQMDQAAITPPTKKKRGRPRKTPETEEAEEEVEEPVERLTKKKPGRPRKNAKENESDKEDEDSVKSEESEEDVPTRRKRGRPRKIQKPNESEQEIEEAVEDEPSEQTTATKRKPGRPRKRQKPNEPEEEIEEAVEDEPSEQTTVTKRKPGRPRKTSKTQESVDAGESVSSTSGRPRRGAKGRAKLDAEDDASAASNMSSTRRSTRGKKKTDAEDDGSVASNVSSTRRSTRAGKRKAVDAVPAVTKTAKRGKKADEDGASSAVLTPSKTTRSTRGKKGQLDGKDSNDYTVSTPSKRTRRSTATQKQDDELDDDDQSTISTASKPKRSTRRKKDAEDDDQSAASTGSKPTARSRRATARKRGDDLNEDDDSSVASRTRRSKRTQGDTSEDESVASASGPAGRPKRNKKGESENEANEKPRRTTRKRGALEKIPE